MLKGATMWKRGMHILLILIGAIQSQAAGNKHPHYRFYLPNAYVGWIQIIFNDPHNPPLSIEDGTVRVEVPESGIVRTSNLRIHASLSPDEFYYRGPNLDGTSQNHPLPTNYILPGIDHGGFGVMDTGGKGPGYSWFIFIGPPELRAKVPLADWNKVIEDYRSTHGGKARIEFSGPYPAPGRMEIIPTHDGIAPMTHGAHL
jgi:hypothetical protein